MANSKMSSHIVVTSHGDKIECDASRDNCDQIAVDVKQAGLLSYKLKAFGGPGNVGKESKERNFTVCDNVMTTIVELIKKQIAFIDGQNLYLKVP